MQKHDIPTPDFWVYSTGDEDMGDVRYPVIGIPDIPLVDPSYYKYQLGVEGRKVIEHMIDALPEIVSRHFEYKLSLLYSLNLARFRH